MAGRHELEGHGVELLGKRLDALHTLVKLIGEYVVPRERYVSRHPIARSGTADGSGNLTLDLGTPTVGHAWYVERLNGDASAGSPAWKVFVGPQAPAATTVPSDAFRQAWLAGATDASFDFTNPILVEPGSFLTVRATGATASATIAVSAQVRVVALGTPSLVPGAPA